MSPEKGPSQKEISSSNDDFSGSMLVFGGEYIHLGLIFVEGRWDFSVFTMISDSEKSIGELGEGSDQDIIIAAWVARVDESEI